MANHCSGRQSMNMAVTNLFRLTCLVSAMALLAPLSVADEPVALEKSDILASPESLAAWKYDFSPADEALLDEIQKGCFQYFWNEVGSGACLAKDKTSDTVCSIAAVGFQLSSLPIGVERGWITRQEGRQRALTVLRALTRRDDNKKDGIYLHFLDEQTGGQPDYSRTKYRYELQASTVDHALLQAGAMTAAVYFGGSVATAAAPIIDEANWRAMYDQEAGFMTMGWKASTDRGVAGPGKIKPNYWQWCSDEERLVDFLAVGAPTDHSVEPAVYYRLKRVVKQKDDIPPYVVSWNGSMFTYFFAHCWIGYRDLAADDPAQFGEAGPAVDWFENSRRATLAHRADVSRRAADFRRSARTAGASRRANSRISIWSPTCGQTSATKIAGSARSCLPMAPARRSCSRPQRAWRRCGNTGRYKVRTASRSPGATRTLAVTDSSTRSASTLRMATRATWALTRDRCCWPSKTRGRASSGSCSCNMRSRDEPSSD